MRVRMLQGSSEDARVLAARVVAGHAALDGEAALQEELERFDIGLRRREAEPRCAGPPSEPNRLAHEPHADAAAPFSRAYRDGLDPGAGRRDLERDEAETPVVVR